jgi:hypothetical protein
MVVWFLFYVFYVYSHVYTLFGPPSPATHTPVVLFFKTGSRCVAQSGLELAMYPRLKALGFIPGTAKIIVIKKWPTNILILNP